MTTTTINAASQPVQTGAAQEAAPSRSFDIKTAFLVVLVAIMAGMSQGYNMFAYPYFQDSEGTNISNAWALSELERLSPYTYGYEEAPVGSLVLSAWTSVMGGLDAFGFSGNTGRVLMLGVHVVSVMLIFGIAKKVTDSNLTAVLASLIFAFSPLVTILQRRVLLDNLMLMWILAATYSSLGPNRRLMHYICSSIFFAIAVLTRMSALFFLPAFIYIIRANADHHHQRFAHSLWLSLAISFISTFPLYAAMRLELFPEGWWIFSGDYPHVSLYEQFMDRGPDTGRFLDIGSNLLPSVALWTDISNAGADPLLFFGGLICAVFVFLMAVNGKHLRPILALLIAYGLYLIIGGRVVHSDIIPLLPLLALCVGIAVSAAVRWMMSNVPNAILKSAVGLVVLAILVYPFFAFYASITYIYTNDQTNDQLLAVEWVQEQLPEDSVVVMDNYAFVELRESFPNAHHYWKVDTDPDVTFNQLDGNWCNIDYIVTTPQLLRDVEGFGLGLMGSALEHSNLLRTYENNGWPIEIRRVSKQYCDIELS